jgi:uncharacterized protein YndB with AHSA1/START domain
MDKNDRDHIAHASVTVDAPVSKVWSALVEPDTIRQYMMGANVVTDWQEGSSIVWEGEWEGKAYRDKGTIVRNEPERLLQYSHFSPLSGEPDVPENYHMVTIALSDEGAGTKVTLTQDNNDSAEAQAHSEKNWTGMLEGLKKIVKSS